MTNTLKTIDDAIRSIDYLIKDLNLRAENGVVPCGNGAWLGINTASEELKALRERLVGDGLVEELADKLEFHLPLKYECRTNYMAGAKATIKTIIGE